MTERQGKRITVQELIMLLKEVPDAIEPIVKSRVDPIIAVSVPDGILPQGWDAVPENPVQHIPGYRRVRCNLAADRYGRNLK